MQELSDGNDDEPEPHAESRQPSFGRDMKRYIVKVRVDLVDRTRIAIVRIHLLHHVGTNPREWVVLDHAHPGACHREPVSVRRVL